MFNRVVISLLLFTTSAVAQQPQQQTPAEIALQINGIIGGWAQTITALQVQNEHLRKQLETVTKERDELKAKH